MATRAEPDIPFRSAMDHQASGGAAFARCMTRSAAAVKGARKEPTGPHAEAIAWWCREFERTRREPYAFCGGKDGDHVRALLALRSDASEAQKAEALSRFKARSTALLESQDAFYAKADLGTLRSAWNKLAQAKPPRPSYDRPAEPETNGHKVDPAVARKAIKDALAAAAGRPVP